MLSRNPLVGISSGFDSGQKIETNEDVVNAIIPPANKSGAGATFQKKYSDVRALNNVKKSETETFK